MFFCQWIDSQPLTLFDIVKKCAICKLRYSIRKVNSICHKLELPPSFSWRIQWDVPRSEALHRETGWGSLSTCQHHQKGVLLSWKARLLKIRAHFFILQSETWMNMWWTSSVWRTNADISKIIHSHPSSLSLLLQLLSTKELFCV